MQTQEDKKALVSQVAKDIQESKALVFADYQGVPVKELSALRKELMQSGSRWQVLKKTLLNIALKEADIDIDARKLSGQIGIAYSSDEVAAAKALSEFAKRHKDLPFSIQGGTLGTKILSKEEVQALAKLPSLDELRAQLVGTLQAPIGGFVRTLSGNLSGLVRVLKAIESEKV